VEGSVKAFTEAAKSHAREQHRLRAGFMAVGLCELPEAVMVFAKFDGPEVGSRW
jgi:hypothetical protein